MGERRSPGGVGADRASPVAGGSIDPAAQGPAVQAGAPASRFVSFIERERLFERGSLQHSAGRPGITVYKGCREVGVQATSKLEVLLAGFDRRTRTSEGATDRSD